jgi:hypothetical protein
MGTKPENHEQLENGRENPFLITEWYTKAEDSGYQIIQVQAGWLKLKRPRFILSKFYARIVEKKKRCRLELV